MNYAYFIKDTAIAVSNVRRSSNVDLRELVESLVPVHIYLAIKHVDHIEILIFFEYHRLGIASIKT